MTVGIFFPPNNEEHRSVLAAFAAGIEEAGFTDILLTSVEDYRPVDLAVIFGVYKKAVPISHARGRIIAQQKILGKPYLVLEKGFIKRDRYYMAGFNGLNNRADFRNLDMSPDRWDKLGITMKPWRIGGKYILLCGQVPWDASCQHVDLINWCVSAAREIRKYTVLPIRFRPHPLVLDATPEILGTIRSTRPLEEDFKDAYAVVTFNSNTAVEAAIEGVPVFAFDKGSMVWPIASLRMNLLSSPLRPSRSHWVNDLAYAQWNLGEMERGLAWNHLFRPAENKLRKKA